MLKKRNSPAGALAGSASIPDVEVPKILRRSSEPQAGAVEAVLVLPNSVLLSQRAQLADLAAKNAAAVYGQPEYVDAGGLMFYGASTTEMFRPRRYNTWNKILKALSPDLPVEQPIGVEFVINLKAVKQIGLTIPQSVLYRATVINKEAQSQNQIKDLSPLRAFHSSLAQTERNGEAPD